MILFSIFRDSADYAPRYASQVKELRNHTDVHVIVAEGDSSDETYEMLRSTDFTVLKVEHGGPKFGSVDNPLRWRQIAAVCNVALTAVVRDLNERGRNEPVVYVESDLIWTPDTMLALAKHTEKVPAVAPMSMHNGRFYDVWGYVKDGVRFAPYPPYHGQLEGDDMVTIDSCGSCVAMSAAAARFVSFSPVDCIRGVGRSLYDHGMSLWLDPTLKVEHP